MAKAKRKPTKTYMASTEIHAEQSVTYHARQHADYVREAFTERDLEGGEMEGSRMRRVSPIRALEGLARKNPKSDNPYLSSVHILAANKYHTLLEAAHCKLNHELKEQVDKSANPDGRMVSHLTASDALARLHLKMPMDYRSMLDLLFVKMPDATINTIWPNRTLQNISKPIIKDTLTWLSVEFGDASN